jgi:hypothetical protein
MGYEYPMVRALVERMGGVMDYWAHPPGGYYLIGLHGRAMVVPVPDTRVNVLDSLYVPKVLNPTHWEDYGDDYGRNAPAVDEWEWKFLRIMDGVSVRGWVCLMHGLNGNGKPREGKPCNCTNLNVPR